MQKETRFLSWWREFVAFRAALGMPEPTCGEAWRAFIRTDCAATL